MDSISGSEKNGVLPDPFGKSGQQKQSPGVQIVGVDCIPLRRGTIRLGIWESRKNRYCLPSSTSTIRIWSGIWWVWTWSYVCCSRSIWQRWSLRTFSRTSVVSLALLSLEATYSSRSNEMWFKNASLASCRQLFFFNSVSSNSFNSNWTSFSLRSTFCSMSDWLLSGNYQEYFWSHLSKF